MTLQNQLSDPLELALDGLESRDDAAFDSSRVVIFGCGHLGKVAFAGALQAGLNVLAFADNNRSNWGKTIEGIPVVSPAEAVANHNQDVLFLVAIYKGTPPRAQ